MKLNIGDKQDKAAKEIKKVVTFSLPVIKITALLFIIMKVFNLGIVGRWGWGRVLSPLWLPLAALLGFVVGGLVVSFIVLSCKEHSQRKKFKKYGR